jgi:O-antigen biosynthesis protein
MRIIARLRYLLILLISRRSRLYEVLRLVRMQMRQNGLRALFQRDTWVLVLSRFKIQYIINHLSRVGDYQSWLEGREPSSWKLSRQRKQAKTFPYQPLVSVITPVFNPSPDVLRDTIHSVVAQTYPRWEFCLANGSPGNQDVREVLNSACKTESRIKIVDLEQNLGISGNTNSALRIAQGDYIVLLDHDDLLAPDLLYELVLNLNEDPDADVVYYDEDTISADKLLRQFPWFKPSAPSPDLMLSTNYLMHSVIRRSLVNELAGFDSQMDGAQDWDLALKLIERQAKLVHIPRMFYHWRAVPGSVASDANAKPWAYTAQKRCLEAHLARLGVPDAQVEFPSSGTVHIRWPITAGKVSIIIPTRDKVDYLAACITSILEKTSYPDYEILVVDNNSTDTETLSYLDQIRSHDLIRVLPYPHPYNFHRINNFAARQANGSILVFLNNDTEVLEPDWLGELAGWVARPEIGIAGAKLLHPDGTFQHAGMVMGMLGHGSHVFDGAPENTYGPFGSSEWYRDYQAVTGACLAIRKQVFTELGGFDETYRVGYGDIDLCLRCNQAGYRVIYTPFARLMHHEGGTRGFSLPPGDVLRASYYMLSQATSQDRYYNPNLSHMERIPTLVKRGEEPREWRLLSILESFDLIAPPAYRFKDGALFPDGPFLAPHGQKLADRNKQADELCPQAPRAFLITHELSRTGAPILLLEMAKYLAKMGWQVTMLSPTEGSLHESCDQANIKVELVASLLNDARLLIPYLADADLVMANTILTFRMIHAAQAFGVPGIWWIYESGFGSQFTREHPAAAQAMQSADAVIFASENTREIYTEFTRMDNIHTIYTGIDVLPPAREHCSQPLELDRDFYNVVLVASIEHRKGQDIFLQAYASLPSEIQAKMRCYLIGRHLDTLSADRKYYQQILKDIRSLPNLLLLGELPEPDVHYILDQADLFVLPSRDEVLPVTIIEAMAFGRPILTTRVGGIPEIIENDINGILVDAENPAALRDQMVRLVRDADRGKRLGLEARKTYESRLTYATFTQKVMKLVDELCFKEISSEGGH